MTRAANSNLNSKELDHFAELELELEKIFFLNSNLNSHKTFQIKNNLKFNKAKVCYYFLNYYNLHYHHEIGLFVFLQPAVYVDTDNGMCF